MADTNTKKSGWSFPTAYTILFVLILFVAALTWIIPAGEYDRVENAELGREVPVPGTYHEVEASPQRLLRSMLMAPIAGMYDPSAGEARAIDVALFVLMIGGFLGVVTKTGAIDAGIGRAMTALRGREIWMIPILMALFWRRTSWAGALAGVVSGTLVTVLWKLELKELVATATGLSPGGRSSRPRDRGRRPCRR